MNATRWFDRDISWQPIDTWPGEYTARRERSRFDTGLGDTQALMHRELEKVGCSGRVIIEADLSRAQIRNDGHPRAKSTIPPPIKISFPTRDLGTLVYATDKFDHWSDNFRAIALGLEALRMVDRYGITNKGQQYAGFAALPEGTEDRGDAATVIAQIARMPLDAVIADPAAAVRQAKFRAHPDRGGNADLFNAVTEAAARMGL